MVHQMLFHPDGMVKDKIVFRTIKVFMQIMNLIFHLNGKEVRLYTDDSLKVLVHIRGQSA